MIWFSFIRRVSLILAIKKKLGIVFALLESKPYSSIMAVNINEDQHIQSNDVP